MAARHRLPPVTVITEMQIMKSMLLAGTDEYCCAC